MNRNDKKDWISSLNSSFSESESVVVASFKGLTVAEISALRKKALEQDATIKVTQNRLTKLALNGTNFEELAPLFKGSTLVAYSKDPVSFAEETGSFVSNQRPSFFCKSYF